MRGVACIITVPFAVGRGRSNPNPKPNPRSGPWKIQGLSGGSEGLFVGRYSGYWNTGKGSTWDGGIHEAAFAHWEGTIKPGTRTAEASTLRCPVSIPATMLRSMNE